MSALNWQPRRGDVVLVQFPFLESTGTAQVKLRPALNVSGTAIHQETADILIAAISSRPASRPSRDRLSDCIWNTRKQLSRPG